MDSPVWSNDLLYVKELILIMIVTIVVIGVCFYVSKRDDRKHTVRAARAATGQTTEAAAPPAAQGDEESRA